tara:strand:- start:14578 stop:14964 length:387 start_codon:yes stop_codon:yes gene_type:complete
VKIYLDSLEIDEVASVEVDGKIGPFSDYVDFSDRFIIYNSWNLICTPNVFEVHSFNRILQVEIHFLWHGKNEESVSVHLKRVDNHELRRGKNFSHEDFKKFLNSYRIEDTKSVANLQKFLEEKGVKII